MEILPLCLWLSVCLFAVACTDVVQTPPRADVTLQLHEGLRPKDIKEGNPVVLVCDVIGHGDNYKVQWYHNDLEVDKGLSAGKYESRAPPPQSFGRSFHLNIMSVKLEDAGNYTCVVENANTVVGTSNTLLLQVKLKRKVKERKSRAAPSSQGPKQEQEQGQHQDEGARGGCWVGDRLYAVGEVWTSTGEQGCAEFSCDSDNEMSSSLCTNFRPGPTCRKIAGVYSAPYPDCCPKLYCPSQRRFGPVAVPGPAQTPPGNNLDA